jgi:DNA polymerase III delta' subunit
VVWGSCDCSNLPRRDPYDLPCGVVASADVNPWTSIVGSTGLQRTLTSSVIGNRVAHAYLLTGGDGQARALAMRAIACSLNCEHDAQAVGQPCGACTPCHKILTDVHPDMVTVVPSGASAQVSIETVRDLIIRLGMLPNEAKIRVVMIEEAAGLAGPAANALLKTLEEPPRRTMFLLATASPEQLLPTIRSRCQRLRLDASAATSTPDHAIAQRILAMCDAADGVEIPAIASAVVEEKGAHLGVVMATSLAFAQAARIAAHSGDVQYARRCAQRAMITQHWHFAMRVHNAHPLLATEAMLSELRELI